MIAVPRFRSVKGYAAACVDGDKNVHLSRLDPVSEDPEAVLCHCPGRDTPQNHRGLR